MSDSAFVDGIDAPEFFVEGFDGYEIKENVLTCYGFRTFRGVKQVVVRLVMPVSGVPDTIGRATSAMSKMPMMALIERGSKQRH